MENEIFFHDYRAEHKKRQDTEESHLSDAIWDHAQASGLFKAYDQAMRAIPKAINPISKASYEKSLEIWNDIARRWGGTIKGEVEYNKWDAIIDVTLPFSEFSGPADMKTLQELAQYANSITFEACENGWVKVHSYFHYFDDLIDGEEKEQILEKLIMEDTELSEMLLQHLKMTNPEKLSDDEEQGDT